MYPATAALRAFKAPIELNELASTIRNRHRNVLREVRIESARGGVVLSGLASAFYGKQLAQHEVLREGLVLMANEIVVRNRAVEGAGA